MHLKAATGQTQQTDPGSGSLRWSHVNSEQQCHTHVSLNYHKITQIYELWNNYSPYLFPPPKIFGKIENTSVIQKWHLHKKVHCRAYITVVLLDQTLDSCTPQSLKDELHGFISIQSDIQQIFRSLKILIQAFWIRVTSNNSYFFNIKIGIQIFFNVIYVVQLLFSSHLPINNTVNFTINENDWVSFSPLLLHCNWTLLWKDQPALLSLILTVVEPVQILTLSRTCKQSLFRRVCFAQNSWILLKVLIITITIIPV